MRFVQIGLISLLLTLTACSVNPVTGEKQFSLISAADEVAIGSKNYIPYQQQQGGQYIVDPELTLYVNQVGQKLAAVSDRTGLPYEFVVLNNGVPNAWALPGGKIAINRGLLIQLKDEAQLAAVLGHEVVHAAARHGATQQTQQTLLGLGTQLVGLAAAQSTEYAGLITQGTNIGASAWQARYGRAQELESDFYGMRYMAKAGYDPVAAIELQQLFLQLKGGRASSGWLEGLFASHPPSQERVQKNRETATTLSGTVRNAQQYQRAIAQIKKDAPAYKKADEAVKALQEKQTSKALSLINEAIALQNQEPNFYITKGQIQLNTNRLSGAKTSFNKAVSLYPEYYVGHLGLGLTQYKQKNYAAADATLLKSAGIVATPTAVFYLGETNLALGNKDKAIGYFRQLANQQGELGEQARSRLNELSPAPAQ